MKSKTILKIIISFVILVSINSCTSNEKKELKNTSNSKEISVFNYDDSEQLAAYNKLNLDETHANLLNPQISKDDFSTVRTSWIDLHQKIGKHLSENNFHWGVKDSTITIVQKIYFNPKGDIENYFFNVLNDNVSKEKKEQFADLILTFAKNNQIGIKRDENFAQCGKTRYLNQ